MAEVTITTPSTASLPDEEEVTPVPLHGKGNKKRNLDEDVDANYQQTLLAGNDSAIFKRPGCHMFARTRHFADLHKDTGVSAVYGSNTGRTNNSYFWLPIVVIIVYIVYSTPIVFILYCHIGFNVTIVLLVSLFTVDYTIIASTISCYCSHNISCCCIVQLWPPVRTLMGTQWCVIPPLLDNIVLSTNQQSLVVGYMV